MTTLATTVRFDDSAMWLELIDGRTLGVPLAWFPRLHWDELDEDISVPALLAGRGESTRRKVSSPQTGNVGRHAAE